jgi:alpha-L-fucosidase
MRTELIKNRKTFPKKPRIRKLGTISCNNIVETTPIVYKGELYRFEVVRRKSFTSATTIDWKELDDSPCLRFVHVRSNAEGPLFAENHTFGFPYAEGDVMYVVTGVGREWGTDKLDFFRSTDLLHWENYAQLHLPGFKIYNMNIAKKDHVYTLLVEISAPVEECGEKPFTFRFLQSTDLINWKLMPRECVFQKDRYAGGGRGDPGRPAGRQRGARHREGIRFPVEDGRDRRDHADV